MHESVLDFVKRSTRKLPAGARVLDVGALDINGSAREVLTDVAEYIGVDLHPGPGVDIVGDAHNLVDLLGPWDPDGGFDIVLCLEMLEHDDAPWLTAAQLAAVVRPGGLVLITARGNGFPEHNPPDRFRFMKDGFRALLEQGGLHVRRITGDPQVSGWFANCTVKGGADG